MSWSLKVPGPDLLRWAVMVQCDGHEPAVEDWLETEAEANAAAIVILETAEKEQWGATTVWVAFVKRQGFVK